MPTKIGLVVVCNVGFAPRDFCAITLWGCSGNISFPDHHPCFGLQDLYPFKCSFDAFCVLPYAQRTLMLCSPLSASYWQGSFQDNFYPLWNLHLLKANLSAAGFCCCLLWMEYQTVCDQHQLSLNSLALRCRQSFQQLKQVWGTAASEAVMERIHSTNYQKNNRTEPVGSKDDPSPEILTPWCLVLYITCSYTKPRLASVTNSMYKIIGPEVWLQFLKLVQAVIRGPQFLSKCMSSWGPITCAHSLASAFSSNYETEICCDSFHD